TEVTLDDGTKAPVNYVLHQADGQWKVFDVFIEGISYVLNYRKQLGAEIREKGLENVIRELERNPRAIEAEQPAQGDSAS
ncbi:MAG: ABC transporter substrate-binding protein, partial [Vicinamibacterales bacterium]